MNKEVNFEIAELLKEKGFNLPTRSYRQKSAVIGSEKILPLVSVEEPYDWNNYSSEVPYYSMPTIAEVVMWLYEKHGIWISVTKDWDVGKCLGFESIIDTNDGFINTETYNSPTEAYEAAITYCLENKIQGGNK